MQSLQCDTGSDSAALQISDVQIRAALPVPTSTSILKIQNEMRGKRLRKIQSAQNRTPESSAACTMF